MKRLAIALAAGIIALELAASSFLGRGLWGLSAWGSISLIAAIVTAVVVVPQFFRSSPADPFGRLPAIRSRMLGIAVVAVVSILCFRLLDARHDLWGERVTLAAAIERGRWLPAGPLSTLLHEGVYRFMNAVFLWNGAQTIAALGVLLGMSYVFAAMRASSLVFRGEGERSARPLGAALLVACGFVATFLRGGNASFATLFAILFLSSALEFARGSRPIALPATLFAAAIVSHVSAIYLLPAFVYLAMLAVRSTATRERTIAALAVPVVVWIAFEALGAAWGFPTPSRFLRAYAAQVTGGLSREGIAAGIATALAALNALFIVGPASIASVAFLFLRRKTPNGVSENDAAHRERMILSLAVAGGLILAFASAGGVDGGLRWHVVASTGPAFALFTLWTIRSRAGSLDDARRAVSALFLAGAFHVVPLALVGAFPSFGERRILSLPLPSGRAEMILAEQAEDTGDRRAAKRWYEASLAVNPKNEEAERRLGDIAMREEEFPAAITHYFNAHELSPGDPGRRFDLAEALSANRWYPEAIAHLETLVAAYPETVSYWRLLGFARNNGDRFEGAVEAYERALSLEPTNRENTVNLASALLNRAAELQVNRRYDEARSMYYRVLDLFPRNWQAYNNLALMEMDLGNYRKAEDILRAALKLHDYEQSLHTSLGMVLEKQGRLREALVHLRRSAQLDPLYSIAPRYIDRIEKKLGINEGD